MTSLVEIQLIAVLISVSCSLVGVFLVLQKMAMMCDAITHTILLGIVLGYFVVKDLSSPYLIVGATIIGVVTVWLIQVISDTRLVAKDASIGIIFSFLFSVGIILISLFASSTHLDTDSVLLGELVFAPFNRLVVFGVDIGAKAIYTSGAILLINVLFIGLFFKELKLVTFDPLLAVSLGISPIIINYMLMTLVSLTTVGAFESVGSLLVIAFMIVPANTAYLLTDDLKKMIALSMLFGGVSAIIGCQVAFVLDISIAGSIAMTCGLIFGIVFVLAPRKGLLCTRLEKKQQKREFEELLVLFYVNNNNSLENININNLNNIVESLIKQNKLEIKYKKDLNQQMNITPLGLEFLSLNNFSK